MSTTLRYDLTRVVETNLPELKRVLGLADLHVREEQEAELISRLAHVLEGKVVHEERPELVPASRPYRLPTASKCLHCDLPIGRGEHAVYVRGVGLHHPACHKEG
jgi:hypothetical protein